MYRTTGDVWGKNPYDYWYVAPNNGSLPNNYDKYLNYLFSDMKTPRCKEMGLESAGDRSRLMSGA